MRTHIAGVAIDDWKLPVFKKHLDAAGYRYEEPVKLAAGSLLLRVRYKWVHQLQPIIEAAQRYCDSMPEGARRTMCPVCTWTYGTHEEGCSRAVN